MVLHTVLLGALLPNVVTGVAAEDPGNGWLDLDREIAGMDETLDGSTSLLELHGRLRLTYANGDENYTGNSGNLSGVELRDARLELEGNVLESDLVVSADAADGSLELRDAYFTHMLSDSIRATVGRFKQPFLYSGRLSTKNLMLFDRTITGEQNHDWDQGLMVDGGFGAFHWLASLQNGVTGSLSDSLWVLHLRMDVLGHPFDEYEGAWGSSEGMNLGIGVSFGDDGGIDNGTKTAVEGELSQGPFYLHAEATAYDEDYDVATQLDPDEILTGFDPMGPVFRGKADTTPSSATFGFLMGESQWELAVRYDNFDDTFDTGKITFGLTRFSDRGHDGKWQLNYTEFDSDNIAYKGNRLEIGYALGW
jgi:hypothetical protein